MCHYICGKHDYRKIKFWYSLSPFLEHFDFSSDGYIYANIDHFDFLGAVGLKDHSFFLTSSNVGKDYPGTNTVGIYGSSRLVLRGIGYNDSEEEQTMFTMDPIVPVNGGYGIVTTIPNDIATNAEDFKHIFSIKNGEPHIWISHPTAWQSAITREQPFSINYGGTGSTGVTNTTTVSDVLTVASNFTCTGVTVSTWGKVCTFYGAFKSTNAIAAGDINNILVATLKTGYHPKSHVVVSAGESGPTLSGELTTAGQLKIDATATQIAANGSFSLGGTYLLA